MQIGTSLLTTNNYHVRVFRLQSPPILHVLALEFLFNSFGPNWRYAKGHRWPEALFAVTKIYRVEKSAGEHDEHNRRPPGKKVGMARKVR